MTEPRPARTGPDALQRLVEELATLPGIGRRSAERIAFHLLQAPMDAAQRLSRSILDLKEQVRHCTVCYGLSEVDPCRICSNPARDGSTILVVEQPRNLISLEQTASHSGVYHVLMGRIDPLGGVGPGDLTVRQLLRRVDEPACNSGGAPVKEVILGLNPDMEGDTTALYLAQQLEARGVRVTRLARGLPAGSQIEYASRAVLSDAIRGRQRMS
jgi:recombination protein RecR